MLWIAKCYYLCIVLFTLQMLTASAAVPVTLLLLYDILEQYRLQGVVVILLLSLCRSIYYQQVKDIAVVIILTMISILHFNTVLSLDDTIPEQNDPVISVLSFNVYDKNHDYQRLDRLLTNNNPDVAIFPESRYGFYTHLVKRWSHEYPYHYAGSYESIFSKYPLERVMNNLTISSFPLHVKMHVLDRQVNVIAIHAISPRSGERVRLRNQRIMAAAEYIALCCHNEPTLIAGDFNTVPWHHSIASFMDISGLRNAYAMPFGMYASWASWLPVIMRVPIDHIFFSNNFSLHFLQRLDDYGSDHFPILATLVAR